LQLRLAQLTICAGLLRYEASAFERSPARHPRRSHVLSAAIKSADGLFQTRPSHVDDGLFPIGSCVRKPCLKGQTGSDADRFYLARRALCAHGHTQNVEPAEQSRHVLPGVATGRQVPKAMPHGNPAPRNIPFHQSLGQTITLSSSRRISASSSALTNSYSLMISQLALSRRKASSAIHASS